MRDDPDPGWIVADGDHGEFGLVLVGDHLDGQSGTRTVAVPILDREGEVCEAEAVVAVVEEARATGGQEVEPDDLSRRLPVDDVTAQRVDFEGGRRPVERGPPLDIPGTAEDRKLSLLGRDRDRSSGEVGDGMPGRTPEMIGPFRPSLDVVSLDAVAEAGEQDHLAIAGRRQSADTGGDGLVPDDGRVQRPAASSGSDPDPDDRPVSRRCRA